MTEEKSLIQTSQNELVQFDPDDSIFMNVQKFAHCQRVAQMFLTTKIWPDNLKTVGDALIVMDLAQRLRFNPVMLAQNISIIHGKPSLDGKLIIALINMCGKYETLKFELIGNLNEPECDTDGCYAFAKNIDTGEIEQGPKVTWQMVKDEGWYNKSGSKWKTLPALMFRYRAATYFGRTCCPEVLLGLETKDELQDIEMQQVNEAFEIKKDHVQIQQQPQSKQISASKGNDIYADTSKKQDWVKPDYASENERDIIPESVTLVGSESVKIDPWQPEQYQYQRTGNFNPGKPESEWNGFAGYCIEHKGSWESATPEQKQTAIQKWQKIYGSAEFPLPMPKQEDKDKDVERELSPEQQHRVDAINELRSNFPDHYIEAVEMLKSAGQVSTSLPRDMNDDDVSALQKKINEMIDAENA